MKSESIQTDKRGRIISVKDDELGCPEIVIFFTKDGFARGGCVHNLNDEYCSVISGKVEYVVGEELKIMWAGDSVKIPKGTPHYFVSLGDSVAIEWGATEEEKKVKHTEYRQIVDRINDTSN